ncbi:vWA domain-containing protein [Armatimonas rosea]|uniref:VWFA domain-containing protein n=1 Tax=Armatimonas rosea TaxID=685828 RepID=A0A7W9SN05_ARMRO|nr:vWA domain-containing protein [Armatimonas rosea]MBB6049612.1 hypothetical protein [Armatimonas rosea]
MSRYTNSDITRYTPSCFCFILDQSSSMAEPFGERDGQAPVTKAEAVAMALNNLLRNLILSCSKSDGVRNYFEIAVIGYGEEVAPAWQGALRGRELVPIAEVAQHVLRLEERVVAMAGGNAETIKAPIWLTPQAKGSTTMCAALHYAHEVLSYWVGRNPASHPPVIVHITDGEATDGEPGPYLDALANLGTGNGRATLFNVHLSSRRVAQPLSFPDKPTELPDRYARLLFDKASYLTPYMRTVAWENGLPLTDDARAFVLNADPSLLVLALEIGTRPGKLW